MSVLSLQRNSGRTVATIAAQRFERLWKAVHGGTCPGEVRSVLSRMLLPWGAQPLSTAPVWPSDIGADNSPFEFSVALAPAVDIRLVVEAQATVPGFRATRDACLRLNTSLAEFGADFGAVEVLRDLFLPNVLHARFALWHAVTLAPGRLRAKAYFNPQILGPLHGTKLVQSALARLGMPHAWATIASALPNPPRGHDIRYFALDMDQPEAPRVKVYRYLEGASPDDLERLAALRPGYTRGEVTEFCRAMTDSSGAFKSRPPCVYMAFSGPSPCPSDVTLQIPIGHYAPDDGVVRERIYGYLRSRGLDADLYDRALSAAAFRPLEAGTGLHSYVSLRTGVTPARVTVYFAAELYAVQSAVPSVSGFFERSGHRGGG
jgi:DMATS type aromatic prenyltransferase